jgi:hypothetical protein
MTNKDPRFEMPGGQYGGGCDSPVGKGYFSGMNFWSSVNAAYDLGRMHFYVKVGKNEKQLDYVGRQHMDLCVDSEGKRAVVMGDFDVTKSVPLKDEVLDRMMAAYVEGAEKLGGERFYTSAKFVNNPDIEAYMRRKYETVKIKVKKLGKQEGVYSTALGMQFIGSKLEGNEEITVFDLSRPLKEQPAEKT